MPKETQSPAAQKIKCPIILMEDIVFPTTEGTIAVMNGQNLVNQLALSNGQLFLAVPKDSAIYTDKQNMTSELESEVEEIGTLVTVQVRVSPEGVTTFKYSAKSRARLIDGGSLTSAFKEGVTVEPVVASETVTPKLMALADYVLETCNKLIALAPFMAYGAEPPWPLPPVESHTPVARCR